LAPQDARRRGGRVGVDRTTTRLEDRLADAGYGIGTQVKYSGQRANVSQSKAISTAIGVLGLLIVAISMVGLVNAITMSILERTREIGVLRCIGARARVIRRIFAAEGLALSLVGWLLGIPVGYGLARMFSWLMLKVIGVDFGFSFPPLNLLVALVGSVVLALLIMQLPLRRGVRYEPGEAIGLHEPALQLSEQQRKRFLGFVRRSTNRATKLSETPTDLTSKRLSKRWTPQLVPVRLYRTQGGRRFESG
jgi:predicted lysophospholipase L1 biosynthesis ABC-type transport system permease subunit